jgi:D-alanyl-D-alanine carboxypeptidase
MFRVCACVLACAIGVSAAPADAASLLLIEADTGKVLHAENATYPWYPASITKLLTAYVTLKAVKAGRVNMDALLTVSANAVAQQPSKMGFPAGTQVTVDNALKMLMVKSANDMAVVLAEGVSGSIEEFANEMNRASGRLGMTQSSWVNPNGLPAEAQITSARDMAILARALIRELPEYDIYWHISAIKFGRRVMRNYNKLIDRYPGADGMKTGFICSSGYNLVASATRNGKRLVAIVLGAPSGAQRAETAAGLLEKGFNGGGLSWLTPSLGTVDALAPIAAAPPDLRDQICGKGRRHRTDHAEEEEAQLPAGSQTDSASASYAAVMPNLRGGGDKASLLGPWTPSMAPIPVSVIPVRGIKTSPDGAPEESVKLAKRKGARKTAVINVPAGNDTPKIATREGVGPKPVVKPKSVAGTPTTERAGNAKEAAPAKPKPAAAKPGDGVPAKKKPVSATSTLTVKPQP